MNLIKGYFFIFSAAFLWGFIGIFAQFAFSEGIDPSEVAFWRALLTWFFFGAYALIKKETKLDTKDIPLLSLFGIGGISVFYISYQYAVKTGGVALASVLLYTAPFWVVIFARIFFKEKLTLVKILSLFLTIFGVFLISKNNQGTDAQISFEAILFGLLSGLSYSLYFILGKHFSNKYSAANLFLYICPIGIILIYPFCTFSHKSIIAWASLISTAFLSTFLANYFYYASLKFLEGSKASILATLEPVTAAVLAYLLFGELFSFTAICGSFAILFAVILNIIKK